ncbi:MAG: M24 family metallopeptidase [Alphaproteobacteria bacterium]|nr:M24 family metallopeptidase [Alphaproteobacteria bacterium]
MTVRPRFQGFDDPVGIDETPARVAALKALLAERALDGFLVPRADEFQGEYVPKHAERLAWISGFTGSWGLAAIFRHRAAIFIDGRYTLQVREQVDLNLFEPIAVHDVAPHDWLAANLRKGDRLGFDPWLHTAAQIGQLRAACEKAGAELVPCKDNLIDAVWQNQPAPPLGAVSVYPESLSGESATDKRHRIAKILHAEKADAAVITLPESICWLLNVRGADVPHTPFALSFAILKHDGTLDWFIDERKLSDAVRAHVGNAVAIEKPDAFLPALKALGEAKKTVRVDRATAAQAIWAALEDSGATLKAESDPCLLPKACKNDVELAGIRAAHRRDGAALTRFLAWLSRASPSGNLTEIETVEKLEDLRAETGALKDVSFDTISGSGPNGAIVHYRVTRKTNRKLGQGELFLLDSGAQYEDGTTDVTRTIAIGTPSAEQRRHFTLVLKGHIALATARFPDGTTGAHLDALARLPLWRAGLDFDHGTGHGVGHYLSVHEGPQNISKRFGPPPLKPGMVCSNEPGFYKTGAYGIRIENLVIVTPPQDVPGGDRAMLGFETVTLAPIDRALIDPALLDADERAWLNAYHARVREAVAPDLSPADREWLIAATEPIA